MAPNRYHLSGPTIDAVLRRARIEYGPDAVIVRAEAVTVGGLAGFFAKHHYEVTVEVPDASAPSTDPLPILPSPGGIAALLADADRAEAEINAAGTASAVSVSTETRTFNSFLEELTTTVMPPARPAAAPEPLTSPGACIVVAGPGQDALDAARAVRSAAGTTALYTAGALRVEGIPFLSNRRQGLEARAEAVLARSPLVIAFGLGRPAETFAHMPALQALNADQLWVAVDATRKHEVTVSWVEAVEAATEVSGVAAFSFADTQTPESVSALGLPVVWIDGAPAGAPSLPSGTARGFTAGP